MTTLLLLLRGDACMYITDDLRLESLREEAVEITDISEDSVVMLP